MPRASLRKVSRLAGVVLAGLAGLLVVALLCTPLVLRGSRFVWALERLLPPIQGSIQLGGGSLGWGSLVAVALGRPATVHLHDVVILDPEGVEVFAAAEVSAAIEIARDPWRVTVHDLRPGVARWRLARMRNRNGIGFTSAFMPRRRRPPGPAPRATRPLEPPRVPLRRAGGDFFFTITSAHLDGLQASFDFPGWGLVLNDIKGTGQLKAGQTGGRPVLAFEVRGVDARGGGLLRILEGASMVPVPFDRVAIDRVGTPADTPFDLLLLVKQAATGRSQLSGRALFARLFAPRGSGGRASMEIEADWRQAGDALTAVAISRGLRDLTVSGSEAQLQARVHSSFNDLDGRFVASGLDVEYQDQRVLDLGLEVLARGPPFTVKVDPLSFRSPAGGRVEASATVSPPGDARLRVRLASLATLPLLPAALQPSLGGIASGRLSARVDVRARRAVLEGMDLTLERHRRGPLPARLRLLTGPPERVDAAASVADTLVASVRSLRWEDGRLVNRGMVARLFGGRLESDTVLVLRPPARAQGPAAVRRMDVSMRASGIDLGQVFPSGRLGGKIGFLLTARGPLDNVTGTLDFPSGTTVTVLGRPYRLPARIRGSSRGDETVLSPFALETPGGGRLAIEGRLVFDRMLDLRLAVERHPLDALPVLSEALPSLRGRFGGKLALRGDPREPTLAGELALHDVRLRGVALGDGRLTLRAQGAGRTVLTGQLFQRIALHGKLAVGRGGPEIDATVDVDRLQLDPFLADVRALAGARLTVGGRFTVTLRRDAPLALTAELPTLSFAWACGRAGGPALPGCLEIDNVGPVRVRALGGLERVELSRSRFRARNQPSELNLAGTLERGVLDAAADGLLSTALLAPLLARWPVVVSGTVDAAMTARGPVDAPVLEGRLRVLEPLAVRTRSGDLSVQLSRGELVLEQNRLRSDGLLVEAPGVRLAVGGSVPLAVNGGGELGGGDQPLRLQIAGVVQAEALRRALPEEILAARGSMRIDARVEGSLARPRFGGQAWLGPLSLRMRYRNTLVQVRGGRLVGDGSRIRLEALTVELAPGGVVVVGPAGRPATVEVLSLVPLTFGWMDMPASAQLRDVDTPWITLREGRIDARLSGQGSRGPLALAGDIQLQSGRFRPRRQPKSTTPAATRIARRLPSQVRAAMVPVVLEVRIRSDGRRFVVDPGWLPDLHLGLDVRVNGPSNRPKVSWDADPHGVYSNVAMFIYKLLS